MSAFTLLVVALALAAPALSVVYAPSTVDGDLIAQNKGFEFAVKHDGTFGTTDVVNNPNFQSNGERLGIRFNLDRKTVAWKNGPRVAGDFIGAHGNQWCLQVAIDSPDEAIRNRVPVLCNGVPNQAPEISPKSLVQGMQSDAGDITVVWTGATDCFCLACQDKDGNSLDISQCTTCVSTDSYVCTKYFGAEVTHTLTVEETDLGATPPKEGDKMTLETVVRNVGNTNWESYYIIRWMNSDPCGTGRDEDTVYNIDYVPVDPVRDRNRVRIFSRDETYPRFGSAVIYCGLEDEDDKYLQVTYFSWSEQVRSEPARGRRDDCDWTTDPFCDPFGGDDWYTNFTCEANCNSGDSSSQDYDQECDTCPRARRSDEQSGFPILSWIRGVQAETVALYAKLARPNQKNVQSRPIASAIPLPAGTSYKHETVFYFTRPSINDPLHRREAALNVAGDTIY